MRGKKKGFTLVELIVVIAIIAIIAAVAIPTTLSYVQKAKENMAENEVLNLMGTIQKSLTLISIEKEGRVAKDTIQEILEGEMPETGYVTEVRISQDGAEKVKVSVVAGDYSTKESSFSYSAFKVYWAESDSVTSYSFVPNADRNGWVLVE